MKANYTGFIYVWHNENNNKMYIGSHYGNENDGYIGSGIYFIRAYTKNPKIFKRYILEYHFKDRKSLLQLEQCYLQKYNAAKNVNFYNISDKAGGGYNLTHIPTINREKIHKDIGRKNHAWLLTATKEQLDSLRLKKQESWKNSSKLEKHRKNTRERRILEELRMTEEEKELRSERCKETIRKYKNSSNVKAGLVKLSKKVTEWHANMTEEEKELRSRTLKDSAEKKKGRHIKKEGVGKCVPENELQI